MTRFELSHGRGNSSGAVFGIRWDSGKQIRRAGLALMALLIASALWASGARADRHAGLVPVVVAEQAHAGSAPERAVRHLGGRVGRHIHVVHSFAAQVPGDQLDALGAARGVASVTPDRAVPLTSTAVPSAGGVTMPSVRTTVGSDATQKDGLTGKGIDVALLDSGVVPVPGLDEGNKVYNGPDFSADAFDPNLRYLDSFGHGTHLAGIIAGHDNSTSFYGIAPDSRIVNVKAAATDGTTTLSQVLAAMDWVISNRDRGGLNIRVLNLSFGVANDGNYTDDPLAIAVEAAWRAGIVVVAAAGNDGNSGLGLDMPAADPFVIAVGATDTRATNGTGDDVVAPFSTVGTPDRKPDLAAPGTSIVSLRVPGSFIDVNFPGGRTTNGYFRGSGTSQSTAVVSGAVADLLQQRPDLTPDQVKDIIATSTTRLAALNPLAGGTGEANVNAATDLATPTLKDVRQLLKAAGGPGNGKLNKLFKSKKTKNVVADPDGGRWSGARWSGARWSGARWSGARWSGLGW